MSTERTLPDVGLVLAFGSDEAVEAVGRQGGPVRGYGHRFSAQWVRAPPTEDVVRAVVRDHVLYDTRGCFAPVVLVVPDARPWWDVLPDALADAERETPAGVASPPLGPEWRRRLGHARVTTGRGVVGMGGGAPRWAAVQLPEDAVIPVALPRFVTLVEAEGPGCLAPWVAHWSSLGTDAAPADVPEGFLRRVAPGDLQRPRLPRYHDGRPMLV